MNEQIAQANEYAAAFESFIQHASIVSILLSLGGSWGIALWLRFPFRQVIPKLWVAWSVYTIEIVVAFLICVATWPNPEPYAWAIFVAGASPLVFAAVSWLLCWKWPALKPFLFLRELGPDDTSSTGDDPRVPPGDTQ